MWFVRSWFPAPTGWKALTLFVPIRKNGANLRRLSSKPLARKWYNRSLMNEQMNTEDILQKLRELKPTIAVRYKAKEILLFGSFVREEQNSSSDIDLLVEFEDEADLFDWIGMMLYLEEVFQCPVDVVPKGTLREELQESVLGQVVAV